MASTSGAAILYSSACERWMGCSELLAWCHACKIVRGGWKLPTTTTTGPCRPHCLAAVRCEAAALCTAIGSNSGWHPSRRIGNSVWESISGSRIIDTVLREEDEPDQITEALQVGMIRCRRPASWVCFGGGARPRRPRVWKTKPTRGTDAKSKKLVELVMSFSNVKEDVYGGLDAWCAWELEFPLVAVKKALRLLQGEQQWRRIIQVSKWMLSKGQGRTMATYELLLQALDEEGRVEEADALFEKILTENEECTPRSLFHRVMTMHERYNQPKRLLEVFADMEELGVRPDMQSVYRVARTYESLGLLKRKELVLQKYPPPTVELKRVKGGRLVRLRVYKHEGDAKKSTSDGSMHHKDEDDGVWSDGEQDGDDLAQPSTLNWDENSSHESDGDWSDGRQDGDDLVHTNLPHGEHNIKDEEERNSANETQDGENRVIVSRSSSL
ncbi:unnamed protein product [Sphagnum jensenii]|uniref:Pentatricopeptide repeat-containing protein n=1 Tax=Sphagnum jensenii TaxID=128206 RepID=A0ABP1AJ85_9BRYO